MSAKAKKPRAAKIPTAARGGDGDAPGYDELHESISGIAESLQSLNRQAVREYPPIVEGIIRFRSRDTHFINREKTKVGSEIPFNRHCYLFQPPRPLPEIDAELKGVTDRILTLIGGLTK